jgi:hypothetical protein
MTDQNTVKFGDTFYLKHQSGQYLVPVDRDDATGRSWVIREK